MLKWILALLAIAGVFALFGRKRLAKAAATAARFLVSLRAFERVKQVLPI